MQGDLVDKMDDVRGVDAALAASPPASSEDSAGAVSLDDRYLSIAQRAMHARTALALEAAHRDGMPGESRVFEEAGLLVVLTSARGLEFLNSVTLTDTASARAIPDVIDQYRRAGTPDPIVVSADESDAGTAELAQLGLEPGNRRPIAFIPLHAVTSVAEPAVSGTVRVTEARAPRDRALFLDILLAGYGGSAEVEQLIRAEHSSDAVRAFMAWIDGELVAGAAMSVHGDSLVLGGAATLEARRDSGAQTALLRAFATDGEVRALAARSTAALAAATAAPDSASLRNLGRAGFTICLRRAWRSGSS